MSFYLVRPTLSNQERRNRYNHLRDLGVPRTWAAAARDWTGIHFARYLERAIALEKGNGNELKTNKEKLY